MRKRTVYFFVVLTLLSLGLILVPRAFSQTQDIKIVSYSHYFDSNGDLIVVGEVQNVGPNTVNPVMLTGSVYSNGVDQDDSYTQVWVSYLTPQQEAPFYMEFPSPYNSPDGTWASVLITNIALTVSQANATSSYQYPDLKITSSSGTIGTSGNYVGAYLVNGVIENTGTQTATNLTVVGAFFNSTGTVIAVGYTNYLTPTSLSPSGTLSFQIAALDLDQNSVAAPLKITKYSLLVQTEGPILQGAPIVTPSSSSSPSPSSSSLPSATPPKAVNSNSSSNAMAIYAIVIVIVILAIAGTILVLSKRKPHETAKAAKEARKKSMVEILPLAFFSKQSGLSLRNISLFKYFLRTLVVYEL